MAALNFIGVPIDSVGRGGGAEHSPAALRELGLPGALGGEDRGDLDLRIRGEERDPASGILASARDALGGIGLVHLDGHLDLYDGETSPTGEAADMPVSVALGLGPAAWVEAAGGASVAPERTALIGFRDKAESLEYGMRQPESIDPPPLRHSAEDLRAAGPGPTAAAVASELAERGPFWLHLDVDVLDQHVFPATDYLMPGGLDLDELSAVLAPLLASPRLTGASLGCYNPDKDPGLSCRHALVQTLAEVRS
jgi:arginase